MLLNEKCYYGRGRDRRIVTVAEGLAIRPKTGSFAGECVNPACCGRILVHKQSKSGGAAHFPHAEPANEKCPLSAPYRPAS